MQMIKMFVMDVTGMQCVLHDECTANSVTEFCQNVRNMVIKHFADTEADDVHVNFQFNANERMPLSVFVHMHPSRPSEQICEVMVHDSEFEAWNLIRGV